MRLLGIDAAAFGNIASLSAALLAASITLVVFVPVFFEIVRSRSPNFLAGQAQRRTLRSTFTTLILTSGLFAADLVLSVIGILHPDRQLGLIAAGCLFVALILLLGATIRLGLATRSLM